jgi:hypothetical protein
MYEFSFNAHDIYLSLSRGLEIAIRALGENTIYLPDPNSIIITRNISGGEAYISKLRIAGTESICDGLIEVKWSEIPSGGYVVSSTTSLNEPCRSIVYLIDGVMPKTVEYIALDGVKSVSDVNFVRRQIRPINYPRFTKMPLWFVTSDIENNSQFYFLWRTCNLESINFGSYYNSRRKSQLIALSYHVRSNEKKRKVVTPTLEFGPCNDRRIVVAKRLNDLEKEGRLVPYKSRNDKPAWLNEIRLTINLHGQHWTGFVHNTFRDMSKALEQLGTDLRPNSSLCILLGWDGPYYRSSLSLIPSVQLGGETDFMQLKQTISKLGSKLVVFSPLNALDIETVRRFGWQNGTLKRPWGAEAWCDWSDWDSDLENEPSVFMNLGYQPFRDYLLTRYSYLVKKFDIDGVYLDITNYWEDDPYYDHFEGLLILVESLRAMKPDFLVCAENWYDLLLGVFPLFGEPGNVMGFYDLMLRYALSAAYIACPSPLGSSGVHGKGRNYIGDLTLKPSNIPYLAITEDWRDCINHLKDIIHKAMTWNSSVMSRSEIDSFINTESK